MEELNLQPELKGYIGNLLTTIILGVLLTSGGVIGIIAGDSFDTMMYPLGLGFVALVISVGYPLYLRKTSYTITDTEVLKDRKTALSEKHEKIPLEKIENTTLKRGFIQQFLGSYGTISISTAGSGQHSGLRLYAVKDAKKVHDTLLNQTVSTTDEEPDKTDSSDVYTEAEKLKLATKRLRNIILNS